MRPVTEARCLPVPADITARHRVNDQSGILGAVAAVYAWARSAIDWVLGGDLSDRGGIGFSARDISRVVRSVDAETVYEAVTMCGWNEGKGGGQER